MKLPVSLVGAGRFIECEPKRSQPGTLQHALKRIARSSEFDKIAKLDPIAEERQARDDVVSLGRRYDDQPLVPIRHTERREAYRHRLGLRRRRHARATVIHHVRHVPVAQPTASPATASADNFEPDFTYRRRSQLGVLVLLL